MFGKWIDKFIFFSAMLVGFSCSRDYSVLPENSSELSHFNYKIEKEGQFSSYIHHWLLVERVSDDPELSSKYMTVNDFIGGYGYSSPHNKSKYYKKYYTDLNDIVVNFHIHQDASIHLVIKESIDEIVAISSADAKKSLEVDERFYFVIDCPDTKYKVSLSISENTLQSGGLQGKFKKLKISDDLSTCKDGVITFGQEVTDNLHYAFSNLHQIDMVLLAVKARNFDGLGHRYRFRSSPIVGYSETFSKLQK